MSRVNRKFRAPAPNMLSVSDFIYVSIWQGFFYGVLSSTPSRIKLLLNVFRVRPKDLVLDVFELMLHNQRLVQKGELIHQSGHSGKGGCKRGAQKFGLCLMLGIRPVLRLVFFNQAFCGVGCLQYIYLPPAHLGGAG